MFKIILLITYCLSTLLIADHPEHPEHPEHPSARSDDKLTVEQLAESIIDYINVDAALKGAFLVYDSKNSEVLHLQLDKVHKERLSNVGGDTYFVCADFEASNGNMYDLDIFMEGKTQDELNVTEITVHKENGKARYKWKLKRGVWIKK